MLHNYDMICSHLLPQKFEPLALAFYLSTLEEFPLGEEIYIDCTKELGNSISTFAAPNNRVQMQKALLIVHL